MRMSHVAETVVLTLAVAGAWACDNNTNRNKAAAAGSAARPATDPTQKPTSQRDVPATVAPAVAARQKAVDSPDKTADGVRYTLVLGDGRTGFAANAVWLTPNAKAKIDELFTNKVALAAAHFEVEGHTDSTGSTEAKRRVGLARAEKVKRYL